MYPYFNKTQRFAIRIHHGAHGKRNVEDATKEPSSPVTVSPRSRPSSGVTRFEHGTFAYVLGIPSKEPEGPTNKDLVLRLNRHCQELKRK